MANPPLPRTPSVEPKILVPKDENEWCSILEENDKARNSSDVLAITIQPTANCQFGCHYCGQTHVNYQMEDHIEQFCLERIKNVLKTSPRYRKLKITWYGGEPLLGLKPLRNLSYRLQKLCAEYGLRYNADMVTNGFLLNKKIFIDLLLEHKVSHYQITLDGVATSHDHRRVLKGNRGKTFDVIYQNVKEIVGTPQYWTGRVCLTLFGERNLTPWAK